MVFNQDLDTYESELENWIIAFFKQSSPSSKLRIPENKHYSQHDQKFILCLDNAEDLINENRDEFRGLIMRLVNSCENLTIIIISSRPIGVINEPLNVLPETIFLDQLKPNQAVELFIDKSKEIYVEEIIDLILVNPKDCISKLLNGVEDLELPLTTQMR